MARPLSSLFALLLGLGCGNQSSSDHNANIGAGSTAGSSSEGANPEGSTVASSSGDRVIDTPEGCDPYVDTPGATALYRLASAQGADGTKTHFFDSPWPAVERSLSEISKLPNPVSADGCELAANRDLATLLSGSFTAPEYRKYLYDLASSRLQKGANHPVMYIQFSEALDTAQLPSPLESLSAESPVFLMNVDEASPQRGALTPVRSRIYTGSRYLPPNTLASTPAVGFPLLSNTRYALVVRTSLGRSDSSPLGQAAELQALIGSDQCDGTSSAHASAAQYLTNAHGIAPQSLAALTVFDTGDPGGTLAQVRAAIRSVPDPNSIGKIQTPNAATTSGSELYVLNGNFQSLIQQVGAPPYLPTLTPDVATQSLRITLDSEDQQGRFLPGGIADGSVVTDNSAPRTEQLPFVLTLPSAAIQEQTVRTPLVVFGPGTGGSRLRRPLK